MFLFNFIIPLKIVAQGLICILSTTVHQKIIIQLYTALDLSFLAQQAWWYASYRILNLLNTRDQLLAYDVAVLF